MGAVAGANARWAGSGGRERAVSGWQLQLQPIATWNVLTSRWSGRVVVAKGRVARRKRGTDETSEQCAEAPVNGQLDRRAQRAGHVGRSGSTLCRKHDGGHR